ncbi:MAG TPA: cell division protein ZapA [Stellaceae bacterium]|jgi:cell division protein ZapA|nr:cell division protein ZapA [Stellaceae bacterium]
MPEIHLTVNGRSYPVACEEGQESRIKELAQYVDRKTMEFVSKLGQIGEARLLVLAALVITDELADAHAALRRHAAAEGNGVDTDALAQGLEELAKRIETIAVRLETPHIAS